jgi:CRP-like cAMP-binding protein
MFSVVIRKAKLLGLLSVAERNALETLSTVIREFRPRQDLTREGDLALFSAILLDGIACRYKTLENGTRQITAFHVPGDMCDLTSILSERQLHSIGAVTRCKAALVSHDGLNATIERIPCLARILWRESLAQAAMYEEWMIGIGRRSAPMRIAHVLCEVAFRLHAIGAVASFRCELPFTQAVLGDATGLSVVHVNRVFHSFLTRRILSVRSGKIGILDWDRLKDVAHFRSEYLHLQGDIHGHREGQTLTETWDATEHQPAECESGHGQLR